MKKIFLIIFISIVTGSLHSQSYQLPAAQMTDTFAKYHQETNPKENFFERLYQASQWFFSPGNKQFTVAAISLAKSRKIGLDSSAGLIFDTIVNTFVRSRIWEEYPEVLANYKEFFVYYNDKICPCATDKLSKAHNGILTEDDMKNCVTNFITDTGYINTIRRLAGNKTMNEIIEIGQHAGRYSLQYCPALGTYFLGIIKDGTAYTFTYELKDEYRHADNTISSLYSSKQLTELTAFFPAYKKYELPIKAAAKLKNDSYRMLSPGGQPVGDGLLSYTKTFYKYIKEKPVLTGQVIYIINELNPESPVVSFTFIPVDKIKDKATLLKQLDVDLIEMPPPPMEELPPGVQEIKIVPKKG